MDQRVERLEARVAELERTNEDLSDELVRLRAETERLGRRVALLTDREAEREAESKVVLSDRPPPHW